MEETKNDCRPAPRATRSIIGPHDTGEEVKRAHAVHVVSPVNFINLKVPNIIKQANKQAWSDPWSPDVDNRGLKIFRIFSSS